jgi:DNA-binding transcriptional LysR family regulator
MELRHLRYFVAVAEAEHFGQAASALGVSQPALSQRVADLERELGVALFERLPRGVRLSAAGRVFLDAAREALAAAAAGAERARDVGRGIAGRVTVGLPETAADASRVRGALATLQAERAAVALSVSGLPWLEQAPAVLDGRLDAGFAWSPDSRADSPAAPPGGVGVDGWHPAGLASVRAYADPVDHVLIPADHPLALHSRDRPVTPAELRMVPFGLFARTLHPGLYDALFATLIAAGALDPRQLAAAAGMAMAGVATVGAGAPLLIATGRWTFVPRSVAADPPSGIVSRTIQGVAMPGGFDVVWRADDRRPLVAALVEPLRGASAGG